MVAAPGPLAAEPGKPPTVEVGSAGLAAPVGQLSPADYQSALLDSGLIWLFVEPLVEDDAITGWRGTAAAGGADPVALLPEALDQLAPTFGRVWRDGVDLPVTFRITDRPPDIQYTGWCFRSGDGVGFVYRVRREEADPDPGRQLRLVIDAEDAVAMGSFEWLVDPDTVEVSPSAARLLGLPGRPAEMGLARFLDHVAAGDRARVEATLRSAAQIGAAFRSRFEVSSDGTLPGRTIRQVGRPLLDAGPRRVVGIVEDITDSYRAELSFVRAQRLASLGMLSAGIAHDFNNVLTVVTMRADMMRESLAAPHPDTAGFDEDIQAILEAAGRASELTRQLMLFAGHQSGDPRPLRPAEVLEDLQPLVERLCGDRVAVEWELPPTAAILADRAQFEQVVVNLVVNARDALDSLDDPARVPSLTISVGEVAATDPLVANHPAADRQPLWVRLRVVDNGPGMSAPTMARACDPFFTTKDRGRGTGLGLSVVFGVLEQLGGWLDIASVPGAGTTVGVFIPPVRAAHGWSAQPEPRRQQLIVVDNDAAVRLSTDRMLTLAGYAVLSAASGAECLQLLDANPAVVAVVTDVDLPGMEGTELARRILTGYAELPVLLVTGSTPPTDVTGHPRLALLAKPATSAQLTAALRRLAGDRTASAS